MIKEKSVFKLAVFIGAFVLSSGVSRAEEPNYVRITTYFSADSFVTATAYSDGLGKTIQSQLHIPHSEEAVVSGTYFDAMGRDSITVKPFVYFTGHSYLIDQLTNSLIAKANNYYGDLAGRFAYSEIQYYDDPLGRIKEIGAPGAAFSLGTAQQPNIHHPKIWFFGLDNEGSHFVPVDTLRAANAEALLDGKGNDENSIYYLTVTRDANGNYSQELKDVQGKTIKKWANSTQDAKDTIVAEYQYDILGNLLTEIPPKESGDLSATTYEYNVLGQLTQKTSPDAGIVEYRYDKIGRLHFVRNQKQKDINSNKFFIYSYDNLGRNMGISLNTDYQTVNAFEDQEFSGGILADVKVTNFYDTILVSNLPTLPNTNLTTLLPGLKNTRGQLVATIAWDEFCGLHNRTAEHCVVDLFSYDDRGRIADKYKYVPGHPLRKLSYSYDLQGNILSVVHDDNTPQAKTFVYNARGQLIEVGKKSKKLVTYSYDQTGKLTQKVFFSPQQGQSDIFGFEEIDYQYNIRDWTTSITTLKKSFFAENIYYNSFRLFPATLYPANPSPNYNGNISFASFTINKDVSTNWSQNLYYQYDRVNRLTAVLNKNTQVDEYSEAYDYDKIGRIRQKREGNSSLTGFSQSYIYEKDNTKTGTPVTNRLAYIANKQAATESNPNYLYDPNGNMVLDRTKKMTISYDWRDFPVMFSFYESIPALDDGKITWQNIDQLEIIKNVRVLSKVNMVYDAAGSRVLKTTLVPVGSN